MRNSLGTALRIGLVAVFVAVARQPACADWHVSDVTYAYGWDAGVDQDVFWPGTNLRQGHITRTGAQMHYYARAEAYALGPTKICFVSTDPGFFQGDQGRRLGYANLLARIYLDGYGPPPKPSTWPQLSFLDATHWITFRELRTVGGEATMSGLSMTGLIGHNPPTIAHPFSVSWNEGCAPYDPHQEPSSLREADYVSRTTEHQYLAAWVYARANAMVHGVEGKVQCVVETIGTSYGIDYP